MMMKMIPLLLIAMSVTMTLTNIPLTLGLMILMLAFMITLLMSIISTSWLGMTIFLIYIGGLLVLFAYFLAIQPNQMLGMNKVMTAMFITLSYLLLSSKLLFPHTTFSNTTLSLPLIMSFPNTPLIIMLAAVLLLILIVVVKLTSAGEAPLRPYE